MASPENTTEEQHSQYGVMLVRPNKPPVPQGQVFATTLLQAFSCAPLLKQHLLKSLQVTNEEFFSLEPVIAEAYNIWDHQRQLHSAQPYADAATEQHNPFPQGQQLGGETFASALLLSLSCTPLLKQHMLRTLQLTDEELASLELAIAEAYNNWNYQRQPHSSQSSDILPRRQAYAPVNQHVSNGTPSTPHAGQPTHQEPSAGDF